MPSAWADHQRSDVFIQAIVLALRASKCDAAVDHLPKIGLAFDHVAPRWRIRIFEIGHKNICAGIHCIDHHFPVGWAGDFDPAILKVRGDCRHLPGTVFSDVFCGR